MTDFSPSRLGAQDLQTEKALVRLRVAALVFAVTSLVNSLPNWLIPPDSRRDFTALSYRVLTAHSAIVATGVCMALLAYVFFTLESIPAKHRKLGGHGFVVLCAAVVAAGTHLQMRTGVTWVGVLILSFPLLVPARPRSAAITLSIASLTSPLALYFAWALGFRAHAPSAGALLVALAPNLICLAIGLVGAHIISELGEEIRQSKALGAYVLDEKIGAGGMGEVWSARHRLLKRPAAVKLMRHVDQPEARQRFEREAQIASSLTSPHSIRIYDFGTGPDETLYLVMELLQGQDLQRRVDTQGPLNSMQARHLLLQACDALEEAHAAGFIHRDIKPSNLFVGRRGAEANFLTVLDFGLGKSVNTGQTKLTGDRDFIGTPGFIAPEQALGLESVDASCDIYSLGAVAYFLVTGALVFESEQPVQVVMQHINASPAAPSTRTELPIAPVVDETLLLCLAKEPAKRPSTAELRARIDRWA
ncbi:MAG: serine/threonine-protein kinase [Myxococcota bacterium]